MNIFPLIIQPFFFFLMCYQLWVGCKKFVLPALQDFIKRRKEEKEFIAQRKENLLYKLVEGERKLSSITFEAKQIEDSFAEWNEKRENKKKRIEKEANERAVKLKAEKITIEERRQQEKCLQEIFPVALKEAQEELARNCPSHLKPFIAHMMQRVSNAS